MRKIIIASVVLISSLGNMLFAQITPTISSIVLNNQQPPITSCGTLNLGSTQNNSLTVSVTLTRPTSLPYGEGTVKVMFKNQFGNDIMLNSQFVIDAEWLGTTTAYKQILANLDANQVIGSDCKLFVQFETTGNIKTSSCLFSIVKATPPSFAITPTNVSLPCGNQNPRTFTVVPSNVPIGATVTYNWSHNGWTVISSTATSRTLVPNPGVTPSSVSVTPILNGVVQTTRTCSVGLTTIPPYTINGNSLPCVGDQVTYTLSNNSTNADITWTLSNSSVATIIGTPSNTSITLQILDDGPLTIHAVASNSCQQSRSASRNINIGTLGYPNLIVEDITSTPYVSPVQASNDCSALGLKLVFPGFRSSTNPALEYQWEKITTDVDWDKDFSSNTTSNVLILFPICNKLFEFKVRARNACGWSDWYYLSYGMNSCLSDCQPPFSGLIGENFILTPNPVTNGNLHITLTPNAPWFANLGSNNGGISIISADPNGGLGSLPPIYVDISIANSSTGISVLNFPNQLISANLDLSTLSPGNYIVTFSYQGQFETYSIVVE